MNALAESCAAALIKFGVETSIVVPGACTSGEVSDEIVRIVDLPAGERPFRCPSIQPQRQRGRVHVLDRIRHDFFQRIGIQELLTPGALI